MAICLVLGVLVGHLLWSSAPVAYAQELLVTHRQEKEALLDVRRKLSDPYKKLNWTKKSDPCSSHWSGVICTLDITDGYSHVLELRLLRFNLSGTLSPKLGQLPYMKRLDFMWNDISGSIPKEIGKITALELLLLSGNQLTGPLPDELGNLPNLSKFQLDLNMISGPIPTSFARLPRVVHFHMNNNRFSGQLPPELSNLTMLKHFLLDNNNLSGYLPPEFSLMPNLTILQLDNNNFAGTVIPDSYAQMSKLVKLSLRNCSLQGTVPDLSKLPRLLYVDLSMNGLTGGITSNRLSENITTIILSHNQLNGSIPSNFSGFSGLQTLLLDNNWLSGSVPSTIWEKVNFTAGDRRLNISLEGNFLSDISGILDVPPNVTLRLQGNPVCDNATQRNISQFCGSGNGNAEGNGEAPPNKTESSCKIQSCALENGYAYVPNLPPGTCFCAAPFGVEVRLRSPSISDFPPYRQDFDKYVTRNIHPDSNHPNDSLSETQVYVDWLRWEEGPRLRMSLLYFPEYSGPNASKTFNSVEVNALREVFAQFKLPPNDVFGPYDLLNFTAGFYTNVVPPFWSSGRGLNKGALAGIVLGSISCAVAVVALLLLLYMRKLQRNSRAEAVQNQSLPKVAMKMDGVKAFGFEELERATNSFSDGTQIGQGGYGKVYKGTLGDGIVVAIKRAQQGSLQGDKEFYTEIEMLSRLHHRNLVSLVGFCDEKDEQMLVYEFMPNGSVHDLLSAKFRAPANLEKRLHIALGAARGILYLHTEADPPIIHRDIKANNILLDSKWTAKVSDFGISRLAPIPDAKGVSTEHVSTNVKGTPGYVDPEYFLTHKLTEKSDVYSLGIVLLELLTGMQPIYQGRNIVREVNTACQSGMMLSVIDRSMGPYPSECVKRLMALALRCSLDETKNRPSMLEVVRELENVSSMLPNSNAAPPDNNTGTSIDSVPSSALYDGGGRSTYATMDLPGSNLVSGVIHTIKPR
ncbi:probable LRR receptor-like serine/threonine-protein kinase At1g06840 [Andrographis paniculata]|uniref:probable LRR receptor-like serine/threonine-protein kinase At1g06840 n=1 Tax=Andrographis paniculata TaxID=175694 RepID=UPI0021E92A38|nr:probable LRR receptor-like serine/threonine-protein kinase At1g06840 [Andrographis paniculata]